jgi:hypothetical protein
MAEFKHRSSPGPANWLRVAIAASPVPADWLGWQSPPRQWERGGAGGGSKKEKERKQTYSYTLLN